MSRCFPYPPPDYRREEESLTESIKLLRKEPETANVRRKEKKREKKERKEKKDKFKDKRENSKHREYDHKKRKCDESIELKLKDGYQKTTAKDVEQLEQSGLTEEHGLPFPTQEPCESSESTQNSSKSRKLEATTVSGARHGSTILRLRLPLQKHKDPKPTPVNIEPCFSVRTSSKDPEANPANEEPCFSGRVTAAPVEQQLAHSTHHQQSSVAQSKTRTEAPMERELGENAHIPSSFRSKSNKRSRKLERQFQDLIMNWKPAPFILDADAGTEDLGWLFEGSRQHRVSSDAQSCSVSSTVEDLSHGNGVSSFQPSACYLPELDMYQLPYVVPF